MMGKPEPMLDEPMPTWQLAWLVGSAMGMIGGFLLAMGALFPWVNDSAVTNGFITDLLGLDAQYVVIFLVPVLGIAAAVLCLFSLLRDYLDAIAAKRLAAAGCIVATISLVFVSAGIMQVTLNLMVKGVTYGIAPFLSIFGSFLAFVGCLLIYLDSRQGGGVVKSAPPSKGSRAPSRKSKAQTHCPHCGSEALAEWTLCPICGKPLGGGKVEAEEEREDTEEGSE
jgi:hypothetical protein